MSVLTGFLTENKRFRVIMAETASIANEIRRRHGLLYPATNALSRFSTGAVLLSSNLKGRDVVGAYLNVTGPLDGLRVEVDAAGRLKGYALQAKAGVDETDNRYVMDLDQLIGTGTLTITRVLEGGKRPYSGNVTVQGGEMALAFSRYLLESEQVHSAMMISNFMEADGTVGRCGGMLIQAMPGVSPGDLERMEDALKGLPPFSNVLETIDSVEQAVELCLPEWGCCRQFEREVRFVCSCSREKVVNMLGGMAGEDLERAGSSDGTYQVSCDYCAASYVVQPEELKQQ